MGKRTIALTAAIAAMLSATSAYAQDSESGASGSFSLSTESGASSEGSSTSGSWLSHYTPESGLIELGLFGGVFLPARDHNLRGPGEPFIRFKRVAPEIGLRAAYFPLSFLGVEGEGAVMPTKDENGGSATLWALRAHAIGQLPGYRITPFALVGMGRLGAKTDNMGSDGDPSFHFGIGVKAAITKMLSVRIDGRDNVTSANPDIRDGKSDDAHHPEVLLGLSLTLGRSAEKAPPAGPKDTDGDGFMDPDDKCPTEPGVAPDGCPVKDTDGDGFMDPDDKCPTEPGVAPDGCPVKDTDGDGILDPDDKCPKEPETKNGFQDEDGCPDEIPEEVKKFTGVIKGIEFDKNKATIRPTSFKLLDAAVKVLTDYPDLRVLITGHTDSDGTAEHNKKLSGDRADSVKQYMVNKGVSEDRIETRGAGEDEPIADNKTKAGKQQNRRIEFKLIQK